MSDERKHYCFLCDGTGQTYFEYKDYEALHFECEQLQRERDEALVNLAAGGVSHEITARQRDEAQHNAAVAIGQNERLRKAIEDVLALMHPDNYEDDKAYELLCAAIEVEGDE